jgi:O-antigen ligase
MRSRPIKFESSPTDHPARSRPELSRALWRAALGTLAIMPIGMAVAHRSSPAFLGLAAALAILATLSEGRLAEFARDARKTLSTALGITALSFLVWTVISVAWSEFPVTSLRALGEFWLSVAFAFVLAISLPARVTRSTFWLLAISCAFAALMMLVELHTGMSLRRALHVRANTFIFNRPMLTLMVLLPPVAAFLFESRRPGGVAAIALTGLAAFAIARSESGAAFLGLYVAIVIFVLAWLAPRLMAAVAAVAFIVTFAVAPFLGPIGDRLIPASVHERLADDHSRDRIDIWLSFGDAIRQDPVLGAGFGISPVMDRTSVAEKVVPEHRELLGVGHPHNAAIQVWAELGIVGVVLTLMIILQVLHAISRQQRAVAGASLALLAGATAVALVGHGAWQGWWAASLGAAIVWLLALRRTELARRTELETIR